MSLLARGDGQHGLLGEESIETILQLWATDSAPDVAGRFWTSRVKEWDLPDLGLGSIAKFLEPLSGAVLKAHTSRPDFDGEVHYVEKAGGAPNDDQRSG